MAEIGLQVLGFTPTRLSQQYGLKTAQEDAKRYWMGRRAILLSNFGYAHLTGDNEGVQDVRKSIREYNQIIPHKALRITSNDIRRSIKARRNRINKVNAGISTQRRYQDLHDEKVELFPEASK